MSFSVVISTKNRSRYVKDTIDKICSQTIKPIEIIVVDDSDKKDTKKVVTIANKKYSNGVDIKHFWGEKGLTRGRLIGSLHSKGEIIIFIDDDLKFSPQLIEKLKTGFKKNTIAVWGKIYFEDVNPSGINRLLDTVYYRFLFGEAGTLGGGLFAVKRNVFSDGIHFDWNLKGYSLFEDKDFACNLVKKYGKKRVKELDQYLGYNRSRLIKETEYYRKTAEGTVYFAKKHGGSLKMIISILLILPVLALYHSLLSGGRGERKAPVKEVLSSFTSVIFNLPSIITGQLV